MDPPKLTVLIGSMCCRYRDLMERARVNFTAPGIRCIAPYDEINLGDLIVRPAGFGTANALVNAERGHWHCVVEHAAEVVVVCKPDGSIGAGTVAELKLAMDRGKTILWD
jgi:enhancing lycopene biosynthesis protein 2